MGGEGEGGGHHSFMTVYSQWNKILLESAKGRYFVPRVLPQVLIYKHSCCVLPTGAQATCILQTEGCV